MRKFSIQIVVFIAAWSISLGCTPEEKDSNAIQTMKALHQTGDLVVRFAKLEIDAARLEEYLSFLKEGIETSVSSEPGVLTMYAVQEEKDSAKITVLEVYASDSAYQAHLATPHFQKYKTATLEMVKSLQLVDLDPIVFGVRSE